MCHIDNLKLRDYIVITSVDNQVQGIDFKGEPLKVEHINYPFVLCSYLGSLATIDVRRHGWVKVTRVYVNKFNKFTVDKVWKETLKSESKKEENGLPPLCEVCSTPMHSVDDKWLCDQCTWRIANDG